MKSHSDSDVPTYPKFHRSDTDSENLREILTQLPEAYFASSERFRCDKPIVSIKVIADTQYFEEGDWWALTQLSVNYTDNTNTLALLPIMKTVFSGAERNYWPPIDKLLTDRPELIAYGVRTESPAFGVRDWVAYDAFVDESFAEKLLQLFSPNRTF